MDKTIRRTVASVVVALTMFTMGAEVAGAAVNAVSITATRTNGCDYSITLEVVGEPEFVAIGGDRPTRLEVPGDTGIAAADFTAGVELGEGIYIIHWDGGEYGDKTIDFTVIVDGVPVFAPPEIQVCDDLDAIAEQAAYEEWLENAPVVPAADPPTGCFSGFSGFGFGASFGVGGFVASPRAAVLGSWIAAPVAPAPTPAPPTPDPCSF